MYIELEHGRAIKYGGNGVPGESTLENYDEFVTGLAVFLRNKSRNNVGIRLSFRKRTVRS